MTSVSKRLHSLHEKRNAEKLYTLAEALDFIIEGSKLKFDETVDIAMNLNVDIRHADQNVRGMVSLPNGTGKSVRVAVFAKDAAAEAAKKAGADAVGADELAEQIQSGDIPFDRIIATPDMMALVGRLGKVLGPKGLMPNPKLGTVTMDVASAVKDAKGGAIEFRAEKAGIVHAGVGKVSFGKKKLLENVQAFIAAIVAAKPSGAKGIYVKRISLSSTMGVGLKIDLSDALQGQNTAAEAA